LLLIPYFYTIYQENRLSYSQLKSWTKHSSGKSSISGASGSSPLAALVVTCVAAVVIPFITRMSDALETLWELFYLQQKWSWSSICEFRYCHDSPLWAIGISVNTYIADLGCKNGYYTIACDFYEHYFIRMRHDTANNDSTMTC